MSKSPFWSQICKNARTQSKFMQRLTRPKLGLKRASLPSHSLQVGGHRVPVTSSASAQLASVLKTGALMASKLP